MSKTFEQGREEVAKLCKYFANNRHDFFTLGVKEAHIRQSLIDPFFEALGWDMRNAAMTALQYREVIPEDSLEIEGQQKAPDYTFRVGTLAKFYTEAKKCGININADPGPAYQLRRYGWSAKVPLSILTDFEELGVYDCSLRPRPTDKASFGRIQYYRSEEYPDRWRELWDIFSREAVWAGAYDRYAASKRKRGTSEVDSEFLKEIEGWRDSLARNIALRNLYLGYDDLNTAVQRTIDRVIFLRMAEDRGSESYGQLLKLCERPDIYARFVGDLCRKADEKYNSGIFHFRKEDGIAESPDQLTPKLQIDDKVFKPILQNLYFENGSPYHFGVLPVEILGTVYERFLGKIIRLTPDHRAKVEEKPEVRKAGGVYYTPAYIVDYIVKNTVGKMIEGKSPAQLAGGKNGQPLRVLDMACGSGSFLLGAYQCLLDHCQKWYLENRPEKHKESVYFDARRKFWRLTITEKKRILTSHIFGVDIDLQAVEVSKLSLLLKVLEGETDETVGQSRQLFHERALPNLSINIKCGNSLIGPDYFSGRLIPDPDEMKRVNPFDWQREFPDVMGSGGFDCVIGNPPWGADIPKTDEKYYRSSYEVAQASSIDSYSLFIEQSTRKLKPTGLLGYITPDTFLRKDDLFPTRSFLLQKKSILELIETGPLFSKVRDTWCLIFVISNDPPTETTKIHHYKLSRFITSVEERLELFGFRKWSSKTKTIQSVWASNPNMIVGYCATDQEQAIILKMKKWQTLGELSEVYRISRGEEGSKLNLTTHLAGKFFMVIPENVERYSVGEGIRIASSTLTPTKIEKLYTHPKIWIIRIQKMRWAQRIVCASDDRLNSAGMKTLQIIVSTTDDISKLKYLVALLSSKLLNFWCINYLADDMNQSYLERIPVRTIDSLKSSEFALQKKVVRHVDQMYSLNKQNVLIEAESQKEIIKRQISAIDHGLDQLVYELYGLTEEEIKIVEDATRNEV